MNKYQSKLINMEKISVIQQIDKQQKEIEILGTIIKILIFLEINLIFLNLYIALVYGVRR